MSAYQAGDVVRDVRGGPFMLVMRSCDEAGVLCVWVSRDEAHSYIMTEYFAAAALELVHHTEAP